MFYYYYSSMRCWLACYDIASYELACELHAVFCFCFRIVLLPLSRAFGILFLDLNIFAYAITYCYCQSERPQSPVFPSPFHPSKP